MGRKPLLQEKQVLAAIERWLVKYGRPPTIKELRSALGVGSTRTALNYLRLLEESGEIERWPGARGIRLLKRKAGGVETVAVPLVGEAPAGPLMIAEENREGWLRLPREFLKPSGERFFLLRVRGNSMNRARVAGSTIESGDLVLVRQQSSGDSGQIVVALIDGEATIKRLLRGPGYYVLKPESTEKTHQSIVLESNFRVQGVVCRVIKNAGHIFDEFNP